MATTDQKGSLLGLRGTPDRANDYLYVWNGTTPYRSTVNNELGIIGTPVGTVDSQTLTNKVLTAPTITAPVLSGTITGTYTLGGTPTFPTSVVTLTGSQTLANKILTSPTISSPTITNASITADSISGFTTSNTGTIYGVPITAGGVPGTSITAGTVGGAQLSTSAITLGYASITANFSTSSSTATQVTGLTVAVTVPAGGRRVKITVFARDAFNTTGSPVSIISIWDGVVGSGTQLSAVQVGGGNQSAVSFPVLAIAITTPAAGPKTYNVGMTSSLSTLFTLEAGATYPAYIIVEAI